MAADSLAAKNATLHLLHNRPPTKHAHCLLTTTPFGCIMPAALGERGKRIHELTSPAALEARVNSKTGSREWIALLECAFVVWAHTAAICIYSHNYPRRDPKACWKISRVFTHRDRCDLLTIHARKTPEDRQRTILGSGASSSNANQATQLIAFQIKRTN